MAMPGCLSKDAAVLTPAFFDRRRVSGGSGTRELCSLLCELLADDLDASDCLVSSVDADRGVAVDLAGFTRMPQRWRGQPREHRLDAYPATRSVLESGAPYTTWVGDPDGDRAEQGLMRTIGVRSGLLMRMDGAGGPYLVEVWSDSRSRAFGRRQTRRSQRLVQRTGPLLADAHDRDLEEDQRFRRATAQAVEIGAADLELPALAEAIGEHLQLDEEELREVRLVALVHEAGRSHIPSTLLGKEEPFTPVEWAIVQRHTLIGQRMLARMPYLRPAVAGVGAIRERWDGGGYPHGFAGDQIPVSSRIVAVCAAYRAMRRGRPGRAPLDHTAAMAELEHGSGSQFDPRVIAAALATIVPCGARPAVRLRVAAI
jgi:hypothetical protein